MQFNFQLKRYQFALNSYSNNIKYSITSCIKTGWEEAHTLIKGVLRNHPK